MFHDDLQSAPGVDLIIQQLDKVGRYVQMDTVSYHGLMAQESLYVEPLCNQVDCVSYMKTRTQMQYI